MPSSLAKLVIAAIAAVGLAGPAAALEDIVAQRGWTRVDYAEAGDCRAEVRTNGQFYRIAGAGLRPGEAVTFHLANADIRPVLARVVADSDGGWERVYLPFLWHLDGGTVSIDLDSPSCSLKLAFDWTRRQA